VCCLTMTSVLDVITVAIVVVVVVVVVVIAHIVCRYFYMITT
jgi:hypothetical protein